MRAGWGLRFLAGCAAWLETDEARPEFPWLCDHRHTATRSALKCGTAEARRRNRWSAHPFNGPLDGIPASKLGSPSLGWYTGPGHVPGALAARLQFSAEIPAGQPQRAGAAVLHRGDYEMLGYFFRGEWNWRLTTGERTTTAAAVVHQIAIDVAAALAMDNPQFNINTFWCQVNPGVALPGHLLAGVSFPRLAAGDLRDYVPYERDAIAAVRGHMMSGQARNARKAAGISSSGMAQACRVTRQPAVPAAADHS